MLCLVISMMRMTIIIMTIYKKHIGKILRGPVPGGAGPWKAGAEAGSGFGVP